MDYEEIIGIGLLFGLSFIFTILTSKNFFAFISFLTFYDVFIVWAGLLELSTLVLLIIFQFVVFYIRIRKGVIQ